MIHWLVYLLMSVELINDDIVVIPHHVNWKDPVKWARSWGSAIVEGVNGGEDKSAGRVIPLNTIEYTMTTFNTPDRARLDARLLEGLKRGRVCAPYWGRGQVIGDNTVPIVQISSGGFDVFHATPLIVGQQYRWTKAAGSLQLTCMTDSLTQSGTFIAGDTYALITATLGTGQAGMIEAVGLTQTVTEGLWPWQIDGYAIFIKPFRTFDDRMGFESRDLQINCGGSGAAPFVADIFHGGGSAITTGGSVDASNIRGYTAPPVAVYQAARKVVGMDGTPFTATWSSFFSAWLVNVAAGQPYIYTKGASDTVLTWVDAYSTPAIFASTEFVPTASFVLIYAPADATPGTIRPAEWIVYTIPGWLAGVEARVRLHFAEIEFGSAGQRVQTCEVLGADLQRITGFDVWQAGGDSMNVASCLDFMVTPGSDGKITVRIRPEAPNFTGIISGIEVFQRTWEVVHLVSPTSANLIAWDGLLKGFYPPGSLVYPLFFGRPKTSGMNGLSPGHGDVRLEIAEPLGNGIVGSNTCPAEVCIPDALLTAPPPVSPWETIVGGVGVFYLKLQYRNPSSACTDLINSVHFNKITDISGTPVLCHAVGGIVGSAGCGPGVTVLTILVEVNQAFLDNAPGDSAVSSSVDVSHRIFDTDTGTCTSLTPSHYDFQPGYGDLADAMNTQIASGGPDHHAGTLGDPCEYTSHPS